MSPFPDTRPPTEPPPAAHDASKPILGLPRSQTKARTNVNKFAVLGLGLLGCLLLIAGLMYMQSHRSRSDSDAQSPQAIARRELALQNTQIQNEEVERTKAAIKKHQDEALAKQRAQEEEARRVESARVEALRLAALKAQGAKAPDLDNPATRKLDGNVLLEAGPLKAPEVGRPATGPQASSHANSLTPRLQPSDFQARAAGRLPNLDYLLKRGTTIPCTLKTGIDTTLPGIVICNALNDVYSANGRVLLIERGASIFGEQQSSLKQGQARTFVVWTRIDNPSGVYADIDSPAADQMGYSGVPGFVNTHFFERFGSAIMLSLIKDFSQIVVNRTSGSNYGYWPFGNTSQATENMAVEALRNSINIPPTLVVNPASVVSVMVARDVSFENVYAIGH